VHVRLVGSERLAGLAEIYMREGFFEGALVREEIASCFIEQDGRRTGIVFLACTHYPFLVNRMRKTAPWPVDWIDSAEAIARRARRCCRRTVGRRTRYRLSRTSPSSPPATPILQSGG
jgi:glutamate racemase